jgi:hypothetical protein
MSDDDIRVTSKDEALDELSELRSGSASGTSKYHPILEKAEEEIEDGNDALVLDSLDGEAISDTQVSGMRDYLNRHRPDTYKVRSHRTDSDGEEYRVVIFLDPES